MASRRPARLLLLASIACGGPLLPSLRAQDAAQPPITPAAAPKEDPASPDVSRPASRPGGERLRPQQQQRLLQQQQLDGIRTPGWPFQPMKLGPNAPMPDQDEWQQTVQLLSGISPNRWKLFEQLLNRPQRADRAKRFLFARYNELRDLERANPTLYGARVEQVKVEDQLFKADTDLREAGSPEEADQLRKTLNERVADSVEKELDHREQRLKQLQERLDREKDALDNDRKRVDEVAERRAESVRRYAERFRAWAGGKLPSAEDASDSRPPRTNPSGAKPDAAPVD